MIKINNKKVNTFRFPLGEINMNHQEYKDETLNILYLYESLDEFFFLILLLKDLRRKNNLIRLTIPYLPFSREDRPIPLHVFTLNSLIEILNSLKLLEIVTLDVHASKALKELNNHKDISVVKELLKKYAPSEHNYHIVFPDKGAKTRFEKLFKDFDTFVINKVRDGYGKILSFDFSGIPNKLTYDTAVIVDDLCSKGGTFIGCAKGLKERGFKYVDLIVTHTEPSIFDGEIFKNNLIDNVYTTNSLLENCNQSDEKLYISDISEILSQSNNNSYAKIITENNGDLTEIKIELFGKDDSVKFDSLVSALLHIKNVKSYSLINFNVNQKIIDSVVTRNRKNIDSWETPYIKVKEKHIR